MYACTEINIATNSSMLSHASKLQKKNIYTPYHKKGEYIILASKITSPYLLVLLFHDEKVENKFNFQPYVINFQLWKVSVHIITTCTNSQSLAPTKHKLYENKAIKTES